MREHHIICCLKHMRPCMIIKHHASTSHHMREFVKTCVLQSTNNMCQPHITFVCESMCNHCMPLPSRMSLTSLKDRADEDDDDCILVLNDDICQTHHICNHFIILIHRVLLSSRAQGPSPSLRICLPPFFFPVGCARPSLACLYS